MSDLQDQETMKAILERIARHNVGLTLASGAGVGTGTLISYRDRPYILTADHNLDSGPPEEMGFHLNVQGNLVQARANELAMEVLTTDYRGLHLRTGDALRDPQNDISAVPIVSTDFFGNYAEPFPVESCALGVSEGTTVIVVGYPATNYAALGAKRVVSAVAFFAEFEPSVQQPLNLKDFDPQLHFLSRYETNSGDEPHGISGAGAWVTLPQTGPIWRPSARLVGVQVSYYRQSRLLKIVNSQTVLKLMARADA